MKVRVLILTFFLLTCRAFAQGKGVAHIPLPADLTGALDGTDYKIRVPADWNGTLLVFAHGTQSGPPAPEVAPAAWPVPSPLLEQQLLALGYALAGSGFANSDKDGVLRTLALTAYFRDLVGNPKRTIIWGNSLGAVVTLKLIEKYPGIYDGAIGNCAPASGSPENMDSALAFALAYSVVFPWHDDAWGPIHDVRDGLKLATDVLPLMIQDGSFPPNSTLATYGRWEFIRLLMHLPPEAFWGKDPQLPMPFFALQMWKTTERRSFVEAESGGPVAENVGAHYELDPPGKLYLASTYGLNPDPLLAWMNERANITADIAARRHAEHWGAFGGALRRPVLNMHATFDGLALTASESDFAARVEAAGCERQLMQVFVNTVGHCRFTAEQYLAALTAMVDWLDTGERPAASLFPASQGFSVGYVPAPWVF